MNMQHATRLIMISARPSLSGLALFVLLFADSIYGHYRGNGVMSKQRFFTGGAAQRSLSGFILLLLLGLTQSAYATTTLTFDTYTNLDANRAVSDGFAFRSIGGRIGGGPVPSGGGGFYDADTDDNIFRAYADTPGGEGSIVGLYVSMSRQDSESFSLYSLDLLTGDISLNPDGMTPGGAEIIGNLAGGGTISTFEIAELGQGGWLNITSVDFRWTTGSSGLGETTLMYLDNIEVGASVVPLPSAVWLLGSGLGMLGWFRRKVSH
jgi:hypothetical protein